MHVHDGWRENQSWEMVRVWVPCELCKLLDTFEATRRVPGAWKPDYGGQTLSRGLPDGELQCVHPCADPLYWVLYPYVPVLIEWSCFKRSWIVASRRWRTWKLRWSRLLHAACGRVNACERFLGRKVWKDMGPVPWEFVIRRSFLRKIWYQIDYYNAKDDNIIWHHMTIYII